MARPRGQSVGDGLRTPHSVSLKVLRLSRPSLHYQHALPVQDKSSSIQIDTKASLAYAAADEHDTFVLSPMLTLPESFRSAYVGEEFACTLCANNEILPEDSSKSIASVKLIAEMQLPSGETTTLDLDGSLRSSSADDGNTQNDTRFQPGDTMQKIVRLSLSEAGQHVLAATVTYTETQHGADGGAQGARVRTFRKLYQFVAQPLINVKTKTGDVSSSKSGNARYALEAQLQNLGERTVCLEAVHVEPAPGYLWRSLNWESFGTSAEPATAPLLQPNDTLQVAFLLEQSDKASASAKVVADQPEDKVVLGQLNIQWRGAMGDRGSLRTSWLTGRRR